MRLKVFLFSFLLLFTVQTTIKGQSADYKALYQLAEVQNSRKQFKTAETTVIRSIQLNSEMPESHLLLSNIAYNQGNRARSVMALYYYLFLESDTAKLSSGIKNLVSKINEGVIRESESKIMIKMPASISDAEFGSAEILVCLLAASRYYNENKEKNDVEFIEMVNENLFNLFTNIRESKKGFWWDFYVTRFCELKSNNVCKAFSHYISRSVYPEETALWFKNNQLQAEQFNKLRESWKPGSIN